MHWRKRLSLLVLSAAVGCADSTAPVEQQGSSLAVPQHSVSSCVTAMVYPCNAVITVYVDSGYTSYRGQQLQAALAEWNSAVLGQYGLPYFDTQIQLGPAPSGNTMQVTFSGSTSYTYYCGAGSDGNVQIFANPGSTCSAADMARSVQDLKAVIVHELGHGIGLHHNKTFLSGCAMSVTPSGSLHQAPCEYERQFIYWAYGLRQIQPATTTQFVTGLSISPWSATLSPGQAQELTAIPNISGGVSLASSDLQTTSTGGYTFQWTSSNSSAGSLSSSTANPTYFTAANVTTNRTTVVSATIAEAPDVVWPVPSGSATITVNVPPPPITSVSVSPGTATVQTNGSASFSATAYSNGTPVSGEYFNWTVSGPGYISGSSYGPGVTVVGSAAGSVTVTATSSNNVTGQATLTVTSPVPPLSADFEVTGSWKNQYYFEFYAPGTADSYTWDFGDGTVRTTSYNFVTHTYSRCGVFTARLTVTRNGQSASSSQNVTVCNIT